MTESESNFPATDLLMLCQRGRVNSIVSLIDKSSLLFPASLEDKLLFGEKVSNKGLKIFDIYFNLLGTI